MTHSIDDQLLSQLSGFITARFGLHFPKKRWRDLERAIIRAAGDFGFNDITSCVKWLITAQLTKSQLDTLVSRLTIGETYFFREAFQLKAFTDEIVPEVIAAKEKKTFSGSAGIPSGVGYSEVMGRDWSRNSWSSARAHSISCGEP